ncbi:hypothetical protein [Marinomonas aquiplantarum]|uniref:Uncharacterized protein n=1 Tax=Marinomonas aquiplantarum TaxID=491951 RepID=A0A366CZH6_9GAMM|nr:hypothetical protein [Marinomonas aquiplantarum]RBO82614.1 hypothetical protein DFP76_10579 [Marinomonas aquiplantarum]
MENFDFITFVVSATIAAVGVFVAFLVWLQSRKDAKLAKETAEFTRKTTEEAAKHAKETAVMSVKPHLSIVSYRDQPKFTATLENNGLGPAMINSFDVYLDGELASGNESHHALEVAIQELDLKISDFSSEYLTSGYAFRPASDVVLMEIVLNENITQAPDHILAELNRIDFVIGYSDIFGNAQEPYDKRGKRKF